jgi:drug/metabolite transporter (DMT)-like permease
MKDCRILRSGIPFPAGCRTAGIVHVRKEASLPRNTVRLGVTLMLVAMAALPLVDVCAKFLGQMGIPALQIVWARMFLGAAMFLPAAYRVAGWRCLLPDRPGFHLARAAFLVGATGFFASALATMPIADSLAIYFVQPLLITALSPLLLGERVGPRRWVAVAVGFCGTLVVIRPGLQEFNPGMALAFASGACMALYMLVTRRLARDEDPVLATFHSNAMGAAMTSLALPFLWQPPGAEGWALLLLMAAVAALAHLLITRAHAMAEASVLAPLVYTEIIMATLAGWWFFGDLPDRWTALGMAILVTCASYVAWRERAAHAPVPHGPRLPGRRPDRSGG